MKTDLRVAVVQAGAIPFEVERSVEKAGSLLADAAARGAELAVFPEAFVSAYPKGLDFGCRLGMRSSEGREDFRRYWASAIEVPGPYTDALGAAARENHVHFVIGVIERDGGPFIARPFSFHRRAAAGQHRKPSLRRWRGRYGFWRRSTIPLLILPIGNGRRICGKNYMPLLRRHVLQGPPAVLRSPCGHRDSWMTSHAHIAFEGPCLSGKLPSISNRLRTMPRSGDDPAILIEASCISPLGQILAGRPMRASDSNREIDLGRYIAGASSTWMLSGTMPSGHLQLYSTKPHPGVVHGRPGPQTCVLATESKNREPALSRKLRLRVAGNKYRTPPVSMVF